ncbi:hypothetical protein [Novosphingobium ginsenosidimutans]|uniref:Uncharacterized protein n=1 Tax=Novosphingobium ginsenosidimutans TaxID=1176536 RepID=A0A5B8S2X7_9SPHN|nr:hypothetical protein [Novosphingobium ginsenosidimutans]QEA15720.1 hypothetical protein FRF71_05985 [Novosphingobium ginsenosidimutans]
MRARTILLAGIAAVAPAPAAQAAPASQATVAFKPPAGPVMISRTVVRSLIDGKEVRATRCYLVWFRPEGSGWRLEGELRDVKVDVPPSLERFAELERNRMEPGFFPIRLDAAGRLVPRSDPLVGDGSRAKAVALGEMMIAGARMSPSARGQASTMLTQVVMAGTGGTAWPVDLFSPARADSVETRGITMPDGTRGLISVTIRAEGLIPGGLPQRVARTVLTDLGGSTRTTREIWTFERTQP